MHKSRAFHRFERRFISNTNISNVCRRLKLPIEYKMVSMAGLMHVQFSHFLTFNAIIGTTECYFLLISNGAVVAHTNAHPCDKVHASDWSGVGIPYRSHWMETRKNAISWRDTWLEAARMMEARMASIAALAHIQLRIYRQLDGPYKCDW